MIAAKKLGAAAASRERNEGTSGRPEPSAVPSDCQLDGRTRMTITAPTSMPGFGKKNLRDTTLHAIIIHTAAEALDKGVEADDVLSTQELINILGSVIAAQGKELTRKEYDYAIAGVYALIKERDFAHELLSRWRTQAARLETQDIRRIKQIFGEAPSELVH